MLTSSKDKRFLAVCLCVSYVLCKIVVAVRGQDIRVEGPKKPIRQGGHARVTILGIPEDSLKDYKINLVPDEGTYYVKLGSDSSRTTYIVFVDEDAPPGIRSFSVSRNLWIKKWGVGLGEALLGLTPEDAKALNTLVSEYPKKYPFAESATSFEVSGILPVTDPPVVTDPTKPPPVDPTKPLPGPNKVTRVTYIYEKDNNNIPGPVALALNKINASAAGIIATEFEEDTISGATNQTPIQYRTALTSARLAGLPALVVQGGITGDAVLFTLKNPLTEAEVINAVNQFIPPVKGNR